MKQTTEYFRDHDRYVAITGEAPKRFPGLVVAWTGDTPESIAETCLSVPTVREMIQVDEVPTEWATAFEAQGITPRKRSTYPSSVRPPRRDEEEFVAHMAAGADPLTALVASGHKLPKKDVELAQSDAEHFEGIMCLGGIVTIIYAIIYMVGKYTCLFQ